MAGTFVLVAVAFLLYDLMVLKRNEMMISTAAESNGLVNSFVPEHLKERLMARQQEEKKYRLTGSMSGSSRRRNLKAFLNDGARTPFVDDDSCSDQSAVIVSAPLADLFLETTVLFAGMWH